MVTSAKSLYRCTWIYKYIILLNISKIFFQKILIPFIFLLLICVHSYPWTCFKWGNELPFFFFFFLFCRLCSHRKKDLLVEIRERFPGWYKRALNCPFLVTNHAALPAVVLFTVQPQPSNPGLHVSIHSFVLLQLQCLSTLFLLSLYLQLCSHGWFFH